ncbi:TIGR02594 family protein [Litoribrevibacter euphylliae]|uniref:TIGR02594 family protein n=1 Tax=Litoribrevibacter euphylliae TaxID=1834034 RepID=A0ABV7HHQ2_9GAMM
MPELKIVMSVGIKGKNLPKDVKAVQEALNELIHLISPIKRLTIDGQLGPKPENSKTVKAIKEFQRKVVMFKRPDGLITVNGRTHKKIKEKQSSTKLAAIVSPATFVSTIPWMKTALAEIGQSEVAGPKANPRILEYFKATKFWGTDDSGGKNAWCGSFVAWVLKKHGFKPVKSGYRAREWVNFGKKIEKPIHGAIGVKTRKGGGHVAFVVGKSSDGKYLYMLGGNQSNQVKVSKYKAEVWDTFVIPTSFDTKQSSLPVYTKKAAIAGSEA